MDKPRDAAGTIHLEVTPAILSKQYSGLTYTSPWFIQQEVIRFPKWRLTWNDLTADGSGFFNQASNQIDINGFIKWIDAENRVILKYDTYSPSVEEVVDKILLSNRKGSKLVTFDQIKLIESDANRNSKVSIVVFDISLVSKFAFLKKNLNYEKHIRFNQSFNFRRSWKQ